MGVTLFESAKASGEVRKVAVAKTMVENSPVLDRIKFKTIQGNAYRYDQEQTLPTVAFRGIGGTYTANEGTYKPVAEVITIMGGEVNVDNFQVKTQGNVHNIKKKQYSLKARAAAHKFNETFFEGDSNVDVFSFDGVRKRLGTSQVILAGPGGAALTLDMLDQLLDKVPFQNKVLYMNRTLRRKVTSLVRAQNGFFKSDIELDEFGKQITRYDGVPILLVEYMHDASTVLDFDEDPGDGTADTASIYCITFGDEEYTYGLLGAGGDWEVRDFGELEAKPQHMGRIEVYLGMTIDHPRSAARLRGITNA